MPGISRSPPPVSGFPGLPGRALLRRVLRVRCPHKHIGDLSTYPLREALAGSGVAHIAIYTRSCRALLSPLDLRTGPEAHPRR